MALNDPAEEIRQLQRCMSDLIGVLALSAVWSGREPGQIITTFHDALMAMLDLDFLYTRARIEANGEPMEVLKTAPHYATAQRVDQIRQALNERFGDDPKKWPLEVRSRLGGQEISLVSMRLGIEAEIGIVLAGSERVDFPTQSERLLLGVAANQAAVGLQQARLLSEQKRIADELDRRVAERTRALAEINEELQLQVGLLQHLPVSAWTLRPDGTPDFVNRVWLEFSGQTLDFVRSHPEAWMTAVHPEDRKAAAKAFWDGVRSEKGFAVQTRSLRARDGTYRWHLQQAVVLRDADGKVLKFVGTTTDIHDQKLAEEAVLASERRLRLAINTMPVLAWSARPDGSVEFVNERWLNYCGLSAREADGWGWTKVFHSDDLGRLTEYWQSILATGEPGEIEVRQRRFDGENRWFLIRANPVRDESGAIVRWYGTNTDIHDRKLADEALRASENNLRQILDSIPGLVSKLTPAGRNELVNQQLLEYFGKTIEEINAWEMNDFVHPDDLQRIVVEFTHSLTTGTPYDSELRYRRADGAYRWFQVRILPVRSAEGKITCWYGLLTDIEDRRRAEEALRVSELDARSLLDNMPGFLSRLSPDGVPEIFNRPFLEYLGATLEELKDWRTSEIVHPDDLGRTIETLGAAIAKGEPFELQYRLRRFDGAYRWFHAVGAPSRDAEGRILHWNALVTDIEDRKRAEEELTRTRAELAHVARVTSLGVLTASIAHEVNQPLSGIVTNASTCLRMLDSDPPNIEGARETARRTIRDGNRASEVITRLRALFKRKEVADEWVNLNDAAREVIALSLSELQSKRIIVRHEFAENLPAVKGDRIQLQQVIQNLLRNASDAMSDIDDRPRQMLIRTETDDGKNVQVTVQDTGIGIAPEAADRLFDRFYTTKEDGMGIGLSVSRSIVEAHQGQLWAAANNGPGSSFIFSIPSDQSS